MSRSTITPHTSHVMGIVAGVRCCTECYAAPGDPIVERKCGSDSRYYDNAARDAGVLRLYTEGTPVHLIAGIYSITRDTVSRIVSRQGVSDEAKANRPRVRGAAITLEQVRKAMELQDARVSWKAIGDAMGLKKSSIMGAVQDFRAGIGRLAAQAAAERQAAGVPLADIAADMGIPYDSLRQKLRRNLVNEQKGAA